ncbi:MAG TPA: hypothetical protein PKA13_09175 [Geminicoccaceae bacterium]|nr:hypothetical protein [Geminicoccus sp.]HMU49936.1 hypothetical protein [Geminicoccaceae bacterium]
MGEAQSGGPAGNGLAELARSLLAEPDLVLAGPGVPPPQPSGGYGAVLSMGDIVTDESGACVLGADGPKVPIVLQTDEAVVAEGAADAFASAAGHDVSGHAFMTFASGVTLYFPPDLDIALMPASS